MFLVFEGATQLGSVCNVKCRISYSFLQTGSNPALGRWPLDPASFATHSIRQSFNGSNPPGFHLHFDQRLRGTEKNSDTPEIAPEMFAQVVVRRGLKPVPRKAQITLRVDRDVLEWFKKRGPGYQTKVNALLRAYMEAHKS